MKVINRKSTKLLMAWSSEVPKSYKHNAITGALHQSKKNSIKFDEVKNFKTKLLN